MSALFSAVRKLQTGLFDALGLVGPSLLRARTNHVRGRGVEPSLLEKPLRDLLQHEDWHEREGAALILGELLRTHRIAVDEALLDALIAALRDSAAEVATAAADTLGRMSHARSLDALRSVLDNTDGYYSPLVRAAAVRSLASNLSQAQLGLVFAAIRDAHVDVSLVAIKAVISRAREAAVYHLLPVLRDQTDFFAREVKLAALEGLRGANNLSASTRQEIERYARELDAPKE